MNYVTVNELVKNEFGEHFVERIKMNYRCF